MIPPEYLNQIITGDARELAKAIPDESIDLIFTDPPYPKEYDHVYYEMGEYAPRILKPGGSLITLCGHYQLPLVIDAMKSLDFHWIGWLSHPGSMRTLYGFKVVCTGKPMLWFTNGKVRDFYGFWWDSTKSIRPEKTNHEWQQSESWAMPSIQKLTEKDDTVLDPFTGGGTVPAVCKMLGRNYIAFEIDPDTAERARERVRNTQPPLFVLQPEQAEMEL